MTDAAYILSSSSSDETSSDDDLGYQDYKEIKELVSIVNEIKTVGTSKLSFTASHSPVSKKSFIHPTLSTLSNSPVK